ncbi:MAG: hypothetical protein AB8B95_01845 [Pseudohongiellaceae bacterium]
MKCESCQIKLTDAVYDNAELLSEPELNGHLETCLECREYLSDLQASVSSLKAQGISNQNFDDIPQRAKLNSLWEELQPSLDKIDADKFREMPKQSHKLAIGSFIGIAASVIVFLGILQTPTEPTSEVAMVDNSINPDLMNYLDRAQIMLLQVANSSAPQAMDIPLSQSFARDMALEASFLNADNNPSVNSGQRKLLRDIEFLLTQIANLDESNAILGVDLLQSFLEEKNILFKIRMLELREKQQLIEL